MAELYQLYQDRILAMRAAMRNQYRQVKERLHKKTFDGPDQVLKYLGRYSHKIGVNNFGILKITNTFKYLDRIANKQPTKTINGADFIRLLYIVEREIASEYLSLYFRAGFL